MSLRVGAYRSLSRVVRALLGRGGTQQRRGLSNLKFPARTQQKRVWFHAASVGELESIWTLIEMFADPAKEFNGEVVLTVFSQSAEKAVERLAADLGAKQARVLFAGYSPWEGDWESVLADALPNLFVTAKYEAWPELWVALGRRKIPLVVVGARARSSLKTARNMVWLLGEELPELRFCLSRETDRAELEKAFPASKIWMCGDPRWDRVTERAQRKHPRADVILEHWKHVARPWGVMGSVWLEDLDFWGQELTRLEGSFMVVPHEVNDENIERIDAHLRKLGFNPHRSSHEEVYAAGDKICLLVDEMGFLSELYRVADWAYVGGGFTKGLHSTIEPAVFGIPILAGPKNASKFPEVDELLGCHQLTLVHSQAELPGWISKHVHGGNRPFDRQVSTRLGATRRVLLKAFREKNASN